MGLFGVVVTAVWAMLPAYLPNSAAVVFGGGRPLDLGYQWRGRRVLGDGKTWRGTLGGWATGTALALGLNQLLPIASGFLGVALPRFPIAAALALPLGSMLGDICASFLKRRSGRERGQSVPVLDQLDFVVGALGLGLLVSPGWFQATFTPAVIVTVVLVSPVLHRVTNIVGYAVGLKDEPW